MVQGVVRHTTFITGENERSQAASARPSSKCRLEAR